MQNDRFGIKAGDVKIISEAPGAADGGSVARKALGVVGAQIKQGIETEREHADLYSFIRENGLPEEDTFYRMIALAHLKEDPEYYKKLEEAGL